VQIELGPFGARERPLALVPLDKSLAGVAHLQQHLGLLAPAGVLTLEEMAEELLLQLQAVVRVEMRPVLDAVALEPFLLRRGAHEAFEVAARMQALAAPVGG
jgi:hypothetical protein